MINKKIYLYSEKFKHKARVLLQRAIKQEQIIPACICDICSYDTDMLYKERENLQDRFEQSPTKKRYPLSAHHYHYQNVVCQYGIVFH